MQSGRFCGIAQKYFKLQCKDIALLKFILDGYDGMATVTTVNPEAAYIRVSAIDNFSAEVDEIISAVQQEFSFTGFELMDSEGFNIKEAS